ncbi:MAG: DUF4335 domain-containing protein [Cyanobacteria bacterium J06639_14]
MTATTQLTSLRYETSTVTLDVMVREAAISQWSELPVVQVLRFQLQVLSLDENVLPVEIRGDREAFQALHQAIQQYVQSNLTGEVKTWRDYPSQAPYCEAAGLTRHILHLGKIKTQAGAATVALGVGQLADLGDVFEQLETRVRLLPITVTPSARRRPWRQWSAIAAGMVAAVGLTTTLWPAYQSQLQVSETALEAPLENQQSSPDPPLSERLDSADAAAEARLFEDLPAESSATGEDSEATATDREAVDLDTPVIPEAAPKADQPRPSSLPSGEAALAKPQGDASVASQPPQADFNETVPLDAAPEETVPSPAPQSPPAISTPESDAIAASEGQARPTEGSPDANLEDRLTATASGNSRNAPGEPTDAAVTRSIPGGAGEAARGAVPQADAGADLALPTELNEAPAIETATTGSTLATLTDEISEQWNPPASLSQPLSYTLILKADGTLLESIPADDVADQYRDRAGLPAVGTQLITPAGAQQLRVLLYPNGDVQVFPVGPE